MPGQHLGLLARKCVFDVTVKLAPKHIYQPLNLSNAKNKGRDKPTHPPTLISALVICCVDSFMLLEALFIKLQNDGQSWSDLRPVADPSSN